MGTRNSKDALAILESAAQSAGYLSSSSSKKAWNELINSISELDQAESYTRGTYSSSTNYQELTQRAAQKRWDALSKLGLDASLFSPDASIDSNWGGVFSPTSLTNRSLTSKYSEILAIIKGNQEHKAILNTVRPIGDIAAESKKLVDQILNTVSQGFQSSSESSSEFNNRIDEVSKARIRGIGTYTQGMPLTPVTGNMGQLSRPELKGY